MGTYEGLISGPDDGGRVRLYLLAGDAGQYVEFARDAPTSVEAQVDDGGTERHTVEIDDDALERSSVDQDAFDAHFAAASGGTVASFVRARDPRDPARTEDGSAFACCYTSLYC